MIGSYLYNTSVPSPDSLFFFIIFIFLMQLCYRPFHSWAMSLFGLYSHLLLMLALETT